MDVTKLRRRSSHFLFSLVGLLLSVSSFADVIKDQIHIKSGIVSGQFSRVEGTLEDPSITVFPTFEAEYEHFTDLRSSYQLKSTFAMDLEDGVARYFYAGVGQKYYNRSSATMVEAVTSSTTVVSQPKRRMYFGWDVGITQVTVEAFSASLQTLATGAELGGRMGYIWQMSENLGVEAELGLAYVYGFSSVAISGTVIRMLGGLTYYYF